MLISRRRLDDDESVVVSTRTHVKALLAPALLLILLAAVAGYLASLPSGEERDVLQLVIWLVALGAIVVLVGKPFLAWLTTTYTVTDRRLITRSGILTRRGHDIPLMRISDVSYEHRLVDRVLGCGTLVVSDASGRIKLRDIPRVEQFHLQVSRLLLDQPSTHRTDDGS